MLASDTGNLDSARLLLAPGADVNRRNGPLSILGVCGGLGAADQTSSNAFVASPNFGRRTFILSIIER